MRGLRAFSVLVLLGIAVSTAALAKRCGEVVVGYGRSAVVLSDRARERRATQTAILNWSARVRQGPGWSYRFWRHALEKKITCGPSVGAIECSVSAKPCRLWP